MRAENNFKQTEIGLIPEDWAVVRLGNYLELLRNGTTKRQNKDGLGYPVTRIETIADAKIDSEKVGYLNNLSDREIARYLMKRGDILLSHINSEPHLGKSAIYEDSPPNLIHGMNLLLIRAKKDLLNSYFLNYLFNFYRRKGTFIVLASRAVGQSSINQGKIKAISIPLPPLPEQQKIARVLSAIQQAVEHQDKIIEATRKLKKSLLHKLFTEGRNGEEQKETEIELIPKSWEVVRLGVVAKITMGQSPPSETYNTNGRGLPFLQGKAEFGEIYPTPVKYCSRPLKIASQEDILISVRAPVGDVNIAPIKCIIGRGLASIRLTNGENLFLFYLLKFHKRKIEEEGTGSTFKAIRKSNLVTLKIPLPPLPEQQKIAHILSTVDKKIEIEERRKATLKELFKTMLHKLMSGEKRLKEVEI